MDYLTLPPEINSGRMYAGAGAAPLLAAAASWDAISAELTTAATEHSATVTALAASWMGPSATAMTAATTTYVTWLTTTAELAAQSAAAASSAVAAYETAFAATVNPALIVANRTQLLTLSATNFLGINTAAIMATEAQYAEYWAQDVTAMVGYQAQSGAATSALPQFTQAPQVANPAGSISSWLTSPNSFLTALSNPATPVGFLETQWLAQASSGPYQIFSYPLMAALMAQANGMMSQSNDLTDEGNRISERLAKDDEGEIINPAESPTMPPSARAPEHADARMGGARAAGNLSVPPNWDKATQQVKLASAATPLPSGGGMGGMIPTPIAAVNAPQKKPRDGNEILVRVKFVPTSGV